MPDEEEELIELPKKKEKESIAKNIELKHIVALAVLSIVTLWIYSSSKEFQAMIQQNMIWLLLIGFGIFYWFTTKGKGIQPIDIIQAENLCRQWIEYKQRKKEITEGRFIIKQDKRKDVDTRPDDYLFEVQINPEGKMESYLIGVDALSGNIILSEPAVITRMSNEDIAKDTYTKKRVVTGEVEVEEV